MNSRIKEMLKYLCCNNGWSYGVFWRINRENSMLITMEDAYFEENIGTVIEKMLQQVHVLGEGIIGQAALTGKYQWMFADTYSGEWGPSGSVEDQHVLQDNSQFRLQFSSGIKTVAVISVAPEGVIQFGSTHKIMETSDFVDQIISLFWHLESFGALLSGNVPTLNNDKYNSSGTVDSGFSSKTAFSNYWNVNPLHDGNSDKLTVKTQAAMVLPHSSSYTGLHMDNMTPEMINSSLNLKRQCQNDDVGQVIPPLPYKDLQHFLSHLPSSSAENYSNRYPTMTTWESSMNSFERQVMPGIRREDNPNSFSTNPNGVYGVNTFQNFQGDANSESSETGGLINTVTQSQVLEVDMPIQCSEENNIQQPISSMHKTEGLLVKGSTSFNPYRGENPVNDLSQYYVQSLEHSKRTVAEKSENSQMLEINDTSSHYFSGIPVNDGNNTLQNPTTDAINSLGLVSDGKENSFTLPQQFTSDNDLFNSLGMTFGPNSETECWDDLILSGGSGSHSSLSNSTSECVSELDAGSITCPQNKFLADFGLEQLLDGGAGNSICYTNKPSSEDHLFRTTMTGAGNDAMYNNQTQLAGLSGISGSMDRSLPNCELQKMAMHVNQKETLPKSHVGAWIGDSYNIITESAVSTPPKKPEEPVRVNRKRARPGESTRPRPKDRQQIQDRVKELREIVPHGVKCSIDGLLDRTIKHMVFLKSVTKHADKLKQAHAPKIIGTESGVVLKDDSSGEGATWAFEVSGKTMICPIIVEDLNPPGQMLIELLCDEGDFFLEIADIIRGFGLTILKGIMEIQEDKIWARFVVEANRNITRMDIFLSLVQFLQQTATGGANFINQPSTVVQTALPFTNYQQSSIPLTIGLSDRLQ